MLLHSDENDKRLLNRQHRPTTSSLHQQVYSWKIIRIHIRIRFGNWCTQHAEKVNSYVLFKVRFTLQIEHSELNKQSYFVDLVVPLSMMFDAWLSCSPNIEALSI